VLGQERLKGRKVWGQGSFDQKSLQNLRISELGQRHGQVEKRLRGCQHAELK